MNRSIRLGVRGRLLLAFLAISAFALIAAASGMFSLTQVGDALERVTEERVPQAFGWLELSRQAERIVHAAPTLLVVDSQSEREEVARSIEGEVERLEQQLAAIEAASEGADEVVALRIRPMVEALGANLVAVEGLIQERLEIAARKSASLRSLDTNTRTAQRLVAPGVLVVDSKLLEWKRKVGEADLLTAEEATLARTLISLFPQQKAEALIASINDQLLKIAAAGSEAEISVLGFPTQRALDELEEVTASLPALIQRRLQRQIAAYRNLAAGDDSLGNVRAAELAALQRAEGVLAENAQVSAALTAAVDRLVGEANQDIHEAGSEASAVRRFSSGVLVGVVVLSLLSSALIVWLYVNRNLIARLTGLSDSMLAIAGGDLRAPLPAVKGSDEIAEMAKALTVFRDTAVEVEENNLLEVAHARQRLLDAIESISEGFAFFDADDRLELCNTRYREFVHDQESKLVQPGMTMEEIARATAAEGVIETGGLDLEAYVAERVAQHRAPGPPQLRRMGDGRWLQISERKIDAGGTVATYSDLTELKQREAELDELVEQLDAAREEAERANEAKSSFLANVSHELRTPLTSILGFARIIQGRLHERILPLIETTDDKRTQRAVRQVRDNLDIILAEGRRLTSLINNVLDLEKIEAGKMVWEKVPVSIAEVIDQAHSATALLFADKGLAFRREVADGLPEIEGDKDKLIQTVINLISNAVKFTDDGSVTCRAELVDGEIRVGVIDTGMGIALDDQPKVFEKFKQVGDTLTDKPKGTGLGLPISKEIVEHHGGRIWVESEPGHGSCFVFTLPIDRAPTTDGDTPADHEVRTEALDAILADLRSRAKVGRARRVHRILVADDDPSIRRLLRQDLEAAGYRILEASNGREAVDLVRRERPDLVILDVLMPEVSGFDVTAELRSDPSTMGIPILMLTIVEEKERAFRVGVNRYLAKPIDKDLLLAEVASLLEMGVSGRKVVVVDEDEAHRRTLFDALTGGGHTVACAASANEGLERARATPRPDLVLADAALAERADLVRLFRSDARLRDLALVLIR